MQEVCDVLFFACTFCTSMTDKCMRCLGYQAQLPTVCNFSCPHSGTVPAGHHDATGPGQSEGDVRQEQARHRPSGDRHAGHQGTNALSFLA